MVSSTVCVLSLFCNVTPQSTCKAWFFYRRVLGFFFFPDESIACSPQSCKCTFSSSATLQTYLVLCKCYKNSAVRFFQYTLKALVSQLCLHTHARSDTAVETATEASVFASFCAFFIEPRFS